VNEIKYARSGDGAFVAYEVIGDGPRDLVLIMEGFVPIDMMDAEPHMARAMRRLASLGRLIRFDRRGTGLSDPISPHDPPTLEQWVEDTLAVMDAVGSQQAVVYSSVEFSPTGLLFAATHPDRVSALVLVNGFARAIYADDYPIGMAQQVFDDLLANTEPTSEKPAIDDVAEFAPSVADDPEFRRWWREAGRRGASPATARALLRVALESDVRAVLPLVQAPVLLPSLKDDIGYAGAKYLADRLSDVKFVPLPGADNFWWASDSADLILDEIEEFLTGMRSGASAERVLATVLFTDIVDSTATSSELGDRRWRELLDRHDAATRRQITRFRGREIKSTGDGFLATFDGPARAVDCAHAIRDSARQLGIEVRSGVHTGEVELRGDDIGGIGVHIAARVAARAEAGTVWVSRTVADLVVGSGLEFEDRGEFELKGVPGQWRLFEVKLP
jgi:class 3 adenylate cyclase